MGRLGIGFVSWYFESIPLMLAILDLVFMQQYQLRHRALRQLRSLKEHLEGRRKVSLLSFLSYGVIDPIWQLLGPAV